MADADLRHGLISQMPLLSLDVIDEPGKNSLPGIGSVIDVAQQRGRERRRIAAQRRFVGLHRVAS